MKELYLSNGKLVQVDNSDYIELSKFNWFQAKGPNTQYAFRNKKKPCGKWSTELMHRAIMKLKDGEFVDHIDGNGLNNCRNNLRSATKSQNGANSRPCGVSKYLGVCWSKSSQRWAVSISKDNKRTYLGGFIKETDAALAYNAIAIKKHGEFARLNIL